MKITLHILVLCFFTLTLISCNQNPRVVKRNAESVVIYPDYVNITLPCNIAPLNFMLREDSIRRVNVMLKGKSDSLKVSSRGNKATFPLNKWKGFISKCVGDTVSVQVLGQMDKEWIQYPTFYWYISPDSIDSHLSYRLIEPGYEVWNRLQLRERCLENNSERILADNKLLEGRCMNCHVYGNNNSQLSMFHLRGEGGGTILNKDGELRKLNLKREGMYSGAVYGNFHPNGNLAVFSSNIIIPQFHTTDNKRLEVYDTESDLMIVDFNNNELITPHIIANENSLETFPIFSADGRWIYFCSAPFTSLPDSIKGVRYSICRVAFNPETKELGDRVDTVWNAVEQNGSASFPKASPDNRYLLFTVADYGTFPIWHKEAHLQLLDLETMEVNLLEIVNSDRSDTYHSWSSNSRWIAFASKRVDGQYGRVYFSHIDDQMNATKPFVLPQNDPEHDDLNLKSYNIPELSNGEVPFDALRLENELSKITLESFN